MPSEKEVYARHAQEYEALVSHEDYQGNLLKAIQGVVKLNGLDVLDLGAGTGRLACLIAPQARSVLAFDLSRHMLGLTHAKLSHGSNQRWLAAVANHPQLPLSAQSVDLIVSGWSISYLAVWQPENWQDQVNAWLEEAQRVLRRPGTVILFESLGSGNETPSRLPHLENFYDWLDEKHFQKEWIRTDYRFATPAEAARLAGFFFGQEMEKCILREELTVLPECTGMWHMRI